MALRMTIARNVAQQWSDKLRCAVTVRQRFACGLPAGRYVYQVTAIDPGGNRELVAARGVLRVEQTE